MTHAARTKLHDSSTDDAGSLLAAAVSKAPSGHANAADLPSSGDGCARDAQTSDFDGGSTLYGKGLSDAAQDARDAGIQDAQVDLAFPPLCSSAGNAQCEGAIDFDVASDGRMVLLPRRRDP